MVVSLVVLDVALWVLGLCAVVVCCGCVLWLAMDLGFCSPIRFSGSRPSRPADSKTRAVGTTLVSTTVSGRRKRAKDWRVGGSTRSSRKITPAMRSENTCSHGLCSDTIYLSFFLSICLSVCQSVCLSISRDYAIIESMMSNKLPNMHKHIASICCTSNFISKREFCQVELAQNGGPSPDQPSSFAEAEMSQVAAKQTTHVGRDKKTYPT